MNALQRLLPVNINSHIIDLNEVNEIRLRYNKPLIYTRKNNRIKTAYTVKRSDIEYVLGIASHNSLYAVGDSLLHGYLPYDKGIRIGVSGEGVVEKGKLTAVKNINSLVIRLPHAVNGIAASLNDLIRNFTNTLIVSPPCGGKTTLLREMVRLLADNGKNVLVIDERNEISATVNGESMLDTGLASDVIVNMPKSDSYESAVRTMSPDIIATDEVFGKSEVESLLDCARSGVDILATVHGKDIDKILSHKIYSPLATVIDNFILLSNTPTIGKIVEVRKNCLG